MECDVGYRLLCDGFSNITFFMLQYDRHHEEIGIKGIPGRHLEPGRHIYSAFVIPGIRSIHHTTDEHYRLTKPG